MPFPLIPVLIGAGIGAMAGGMSGEDGWDWKRAFGGALLGGATGGVGAAAMAPAAAMSAGPLAASTAGASTLGAGTVTGLGASAAPAAGLASTTAPGLAAMGGVGGTTAPAGLSGVGGIGGLGFSGSSPAAIQAAQAKAALLAPGKAVPVSYGKYGPTTKAGFAQNEALMKEATAGFDYGQLGDTLQSMGGEAQQESPNSFPDPAPLQVGQGRGSDSVTTDLERERQAIQASIPTSGATGLSGVERAAKGGIATKFGMMKTPSGSLTGGEIVGPGTGTSDTIRSAIYPDLASKLGASSMQALQGGGHQVQKAALSDGEFVLTAKAVEGLGKNANAPPGQEREYGSKLLDQAMNQWQRI
jgi:hypothetical protein